MKSIMNVSKQDKTFIHSVHIMQQILSTRVLLVKQPTDPP